METGDVHQGQATIRRQVRVTPSMCGQNSLFFGRLGDWTWETVSALTGTNVFTAHNAAGQSTYLAFCYVRVRGSTTIHPHGFSFGDELAVTSRSFDFGSESVLTLHQIRRDQPGDPTATLDPYEFYEQPHIESLYAETFNRWVARSRQGSNDDLISSAPTDFYHRRLPSLPRIYSPRYALREARMNASFHGPCIAGYEMIVPKFDTCYAIDITRDVNGVGLIYFASYFSFIDIAVLRLWRRLERSDHRFLNRRLLDHRLAYYGNADLDSVLELTLRLWRHAENPDDEIVEAVIRDQTTQRLLAVASVRSVLEEK
jgi:probable biosynthetic protein (TIGR04098 family)